MKVLSLFTGGGLGDYGLELAGMEIVGQVEIDAYCQKILALRWPHVHKWKDIRGVKGREVIQLCGRIDIISGGFPCQDISTAGRGAGITGERSGLWKEMFRIICEVRPRYVLVENVTALLGRGLGVVLGDLAEIGYDTEWDCIPASAIGAPHQRDRIWIVAYSIREGISGRDFSGLDQTRKKISEPKNRPSASNEFSNGSKKSSDVADPNRANGKTRSSTVQTKGKWRPGSSGRGRKLSNSTSTGLERNQPTIFPRQQNGLLTECGWWESEPDVGRVVTRYSVGSHTGGVDAHKVCIQKASAKGIPQTDRLRTLREHQKTSKASPQGFRRCSFCGHSVSGMPCEGPCSPWYLGKRQSEAQDLRCLQEGIFSLMPQSDQDLRTRVLGNTRTTECEQTVASRADRLKLLGNGQVVQVVQFIGEKIMEFDRG